MKLKSYKSVNFMLLLSKNLDSQLSNVIKHNFICFDFLKQIQRSQLLEEN